MAESNEDLDFYEELRRVRSADPFQPFAIILNRGVRYEVTDPWQTAAGRSTFVIFPPRSGFVFFPLHQISSIEVLEPSH